MSIAYKDYKAPSAEELQRLYTELETNYFGDDPQEKAEIDHFRRVITGAKLFVDVGASLGQYTQLANEVITGGDILSLEADPTRFDRLKVLSRAWEEQSGNHIVPHWGAVCERDGRTPFFVANANVSGGLFLNRETETLAQDYAWQKIEIPCITLDTLIGERTPDLIKIDVEGAECRVLEGARRLIGKRKTRFFVEVHPWGDASYGKRPGDVFRFFLKNGYSYRRLGRRWLFEPERPGTFECFYTLVLIPVVDIVLRHPSLRRVAKAVAGYSDKVWRAISGGPPRR